MSRSYKYLFVLLIFCFSGIGQDKKVKTQYDKAYDFYFKDKLRGALTVYDTTRPLSVEDWIGCSVIEGLVFSDSISFNEGRKYFDRVAEVIDQSPDPKVRTGYYYGMGNGYYREGDFNEAIKYFLKMELEGIKAKLLGTQKTACFYLAESHKRIGKIAIANQYIKKASEIAKSKNDSSAIIRYCDVLADNYMRLSEKNPKAYSDTILSIVKDAEKYLNRNNHYLASFFESAYSKVFNTINDFENAILHSKKALNYSIMVGDSANILVACSNIGQDYLDLKQYDSALVYQRRMDEIKKTDRSLMSKDQRNFFYNYYRIYKNMGKTDLALSYLEKWYDQDAKFNSEKNLEVQELRADYEAKKTSLQINNEKEKAKALYEQKRNFYLFIFGAFFLFFVLLVFFIFYRLKANKEKEKRDLLIQAQMAELSALKAQMNPHFIFNSLIAIQNYVYKHEPSEVAGYISNFAKLMRMILENSRKESITIEKEIELIKYYLELQQLRFPDKFDFTIKVDPQIDQESILIPPMLSQPIIENAIEHGIMNKQNGKGNITIDFIQKQELIELVIRDNGIGRERAGVIKDSMEALHKSLSTTITEERLNLLNRKTKKRFSIEVKDLKSSDGSSTGTEVILRMPEL